MYNWGITQLLVVQSHQQRHHLDSYDPKAVTVGVVQSHPNPPIHHTVHSPGWFNPTPVPSLPLVCVMDWRTFRGHEPHEK